LGILHGDYVPGLLPGGQEVVCNLGLRENITKHADNDRYNENIFTFRVGPSRYSFIVHADIVSQHSKVLCRLIGGSFKEGIEKGAELPEVEPETFGHFLAYAYFMSNGALCNETTTQTSSAGRMPTSRLIELLLVNEHKIFKCKSCWNTSELRFSFSFPHCGKCSQDELKNLKWLSHCIVPGCPEDGQYMKGLFCEKCLRILDVFNYRNEFTATGASKVQLRLSRRLEELQSFHFDIPLRVKDISEAMENFVPMPYPAPTTLPDIARLAIFADIYEIEPLSQAVLLSLYQKLTREPLDEDSIATVSEVSELVYNCTTGSDSDSTSKGTHVLRRMLSEFIAVHRGKFTASSTFMELLRQGGELPGDILSATV
jgi:hypothetical protein